MLEWNCYLQHEKGIGIGLIKVLNSNFQTRHQRDPARSNLQKLNPGL